MEKVLVWLIVVAAAIFVGRRVYSLFRGKTKGCGCDSGCSCCDVGDCDRKDQGD